MGKIRTARLNDPFLIDECLSPDLVALAAARHHYATHVVYRGLQGKLDRDLMPAIQDGNFVLVISNGKDFLALYAQVDLHPGLVIIIPGALGREMQLEFFRRVLDVVEPMSDLVNKVIEVFSDGSVDLRD
jgi:predicted nuclease of predicted toxin-antitoxin system